MKIPTTQAVRMLRDHHVEFVPHLYNYVEKGGTTASSEALGVSEHLVIKTLIMEKDDKTPIVVLMHGDSEVSTKNLARHIGAKSVSPCKPEVANKHSGYLVGGTSPFGTKKEMPIYIQETILKLPLIYINGGARGFLVSLPVTELIRVLRPIALEIRA